MHRCDVGESSAAAAGSLQWKNLTVHHYSIKNLGYHKRDHVDLINHPTRRKQQSNSVIIK